YHDGSVSPVVPGIYPTAVNDSGVAVGGVYAGDAFLFDGVSVYPLDDIILPLFSGVIHLVRGINNLGQIAGTRWDGSHEYAIRLYPYTPALCGNGSLDPGEQCDDGNLVDDDGCDSNCTLPACGNGVVDATEECDDANRSNGDQCENDCTSPHCGNG